MADRRQLAVFTSEFRELLAQREPVPLSTYEATLAGPWRVEPRGEEYAVMREGDPEPEAVLRFRDTALLLAASLPVTGRGARYWTALERADDGKPVLTLKTIVGERGLATVGRLRSRHEELLATLSTAEHLLRSPASLALLLEAAPAEALSQGFRATCRAAAEHEDLIARFSRERAPESPVSRHRGRPKHRPATCRGPAWASDVRPL